MPMETILNSRGSIRAMKTFFQKHQRLHIWLLTDLSLLAVFCLVRENRTWMNALAKHAPDTSSEAELPLLERQDTGETGLTARCWAQLAPR